MNLPDFPEKGKTYPAANAFEVLTYLRNNDYMWATWDHECLTISIPKKRGSGTTFKSIKKKHQEELASMLRDSPEKDPVAAAFHIIDFPKRTRTGGAGRAKKTKDEYIKELYKGVQSNSNGVMAINAALLWSLDPETKTNRSGESVEGYRRATFFFEWDNKNRQLVMKLKK